MMYKVKLDYGSEYYFDNIEEAGAFFDQAIRHAENDLKWAAIEPAIRHAENDLKWAAIEEPVYSVPDETEEVKDD